MYYNLLLTLLCSEFIHLNCGLPMANAERNLLDTIMADMNNVRTSTSCSTRNATARDHAEAYETPKKKTRKASSSGEPDDARAVSEAANNPPSDMGVLKSPMSALTKMVNESIAPRHEASLWCSCGTCQYGRRKRRFRFRGIWMWSEWGGLSHRRARES